MIRDYCTSPIRFNSSYGNYEPAEYENYLVCDYCKKNEDPDEDTNLTEEMYEISWDEDFHICEDCIEEFLLDFVNDNAIESKVFCPVCNKEFSSEDFSSFREHMLDKHLFLVDA